jgi:hypothetical protein
MVNKSEHIEIPEVDLPANAIHDQMIGGPVRSADRTVYSATWQQESRHVHQ